MSDLPHNPRLSTAVRGIIIAAIIVLYGWTVRQPQAHFATGLLIAVVLQSVVLILRRLAPATLAPQAIFILELLADAATVLLFALSVFGGILALLAAV